MPRKSPPQKEQEEKEPERLDGAVLLAIALKILVILLFAAKGGGFLYQGF